MRIGHASLASAPVWRSDEARRQLTEAVLITVTGIAAGLRNTG